jgi:hypothetical protein
MTKRKVVKKPLKPLKFTVVVHTSGPKVKRVNTKNFKSRACAHKYALKMQKKNTLKKPVHVKVKLVK